MYKYVIRNGLISAIADDVMGIQSASDTNINGRLTSMIARPGLKCESDSDFEISWIAMPGDFYEVTCSNLGVVVFPDYIVVDGAGESLVNIEMLLTNGTLFIQLQRYALYSDPGTFIDGHPVDPDTGLAPSYGDDTLLTYAMRLILSRVIAVSPADDLITIGKLTRDSHGVVTFTDMRSDNALQLVMAGYETPYTATINNLSVRSVYQHEILSERAAQYPASEVNLTSPSSNMTSNKMFFNIEWDVVDDAILYELRLTPITPSGLYLRPMWQMIPADLGGTQARATIEVCEALEYEIGVRAIEDTPNRTKGPESILKAIAGADLATIPMPAPSFAASYIANSVPNVVELITALSNTIQEPRGVQIYMTEQSPPIGGVLVEPTGILIYDGKPGIFRFVLPEGKLCWFLARSVGPGGVVSDSIASETAFVGSPNSEPAESSAPVEITLDFPISLRCDGTETWLNYATGIELFRFLNPSSSPSLHYVIRRLEFYSSGSWISGKDLDGELELIVGDNIDSETKLVFEWDDFPGTWTHADPLPPASAPSAGEYYWAGLDKTGEWADNTYAPEELGVYLRYTETGSSWHWNMAGSLRVVMMKETASAPISS